MEGAFDLNTRIFLSLNSRLPYGDKSPQMDFFDAAFKGDLRHIREMARGKDAEGKARLVDVCVGGQGPLQAAARMGRLDVVKCMVKELGLDINLGSSDTGVTALHAAALDGKLDIVRYLLNNGADPNKKDQPGEVPLHCAAKYGHDEVAKLLLSRGANVDMAYFHGTPLHIAAVHGKADFMKVLLEHHADPNKISEALGTPLVATLNAASDGLPESIALKCLKLLVEARADVNFVGPDTPLVVATTHGLTDCIKYLLNVGANSNIPQKCCGAMPIEVAAGYGRRKDVELLFPSTSPIQTVSTWTVDGILSNYQSKHSNPKVEKYGKTAKLKLKLDGDTAVGRENYLAASKLYTQAIELDPDDATLYSNRSLCHVRIGEANKALLDANSCIKIRPEWLKGYYRKGLALMSLKEYKEACDAFLAGLKLDPTNVDMERMFREAIEAMKKDHVTA